MFLQHTAAPAPRLYKCSLPSANLRVDASRLDGWPVDHVLNRFPGRVPGVRTVVEFRLVAGGDLSIFYRLDLGLTQLDGFSGIGPSGSKPPARHLPVCQPILRGLPGRLANPVVTRGSRLRQVGLAEKTPSRNAGAQPDTIKGGFPRIAARLLTLMVRSLSTILPPPALNRQSIT